MEVLRVLVGEAGKRADLGEVERMAQSLRHALNALASEQREARVSLRFEVVEASIGSLQLGVAPVDSDILADTLFGQFIQDIIGLKEGRFRPTMSSETLAEYRDLFKAPSSKTPVTYVYRDSQAVIDERARAMLEEKIISTRAYNISIIGTIESVSVHQQPYTCSLYTKLEPKQRIRCQFSAPMLYAVADALKSKRMVEVIGDAEYGFVGLYPIRLIMTQPPQPVEPDMDFLRKAVRSLDIVPEGMSISDYLDRIRGDYAEAE